MATPHSDSQLAICLLHRSFLAMDRPDHVTFEYTHRTAPLIVCIYRSGNCIGSFDNCAYLTTTDANHYARWLYKDAPDGTGVMLALAIVLAGVGTMLLAFLQWGPARLQPFTGRMVAVPCRETDIYSRLWCVYNYT